MKRGREETTTTTTTIGPPGKRLRYTPKTSSAFRSNSMDIEPSTRPGFYTVARTRGPFAKGEMKYYDTYLVSSGINIPASTDWTGTEFDPQSTIASSGAVANPLCLNAPKQGAGINERIGREIMIHKIKIRGVISAATLLNADPTGFADQSVRVCLVQDTQSNSLQAQGEDVMEGTSGTGGWLSYQNIANFGRFKVLKDKLFQCEIHNLSPIDNAHVYSATYRKNFKWNINFKVPVRVRFNATNGGTVADIVDNSFHIIANSNAAAPVSRIQYKARLCYKDI